MLLSACSQAVTSSGNSSDTNPPSSGMDSYDWMTNSTEYILVLSWWGEADAYLENDNYDSSTMAPRELFELVAENEVLYIPLDKVESILDQMPAAIADQSEMDMMRNPVDNIFYLQFVRDGILGERLHYPTYNCDIAPSYHQFITELIKEATPVFTYSMKSDNRDGFIDNMASINRQEGLAAYFPEGEAYNIRPYVNLAFSYDNSDRKYHTDAISNSASYNGREQDDPRLLECDHVFLPIIDMIENFSNLYAHSGVGGGRQSFHEGLIGFDRRMTIYLDSPLSENQYSEIVELWDSLTGDKPYVSSEIVYEPLPDIPIVILAKNDLTTTEIERLNTDYGLSPLGENEEISIYHYKELLIPFPEPVPAPFGFVPSDVPEGTVAPDLYYPGRIQAPEEAMPMRKGPGYDYDIVVSLQPESKVYEIGYMKYGAETWAFIQFDEYYGWVLRDQLTFHPDDPPPPPAPAKPVIYLYPEQELDVHVQVNFPNGYFTCTYPEYDNGWNVTAYPDGSLINYADGREYSYLYWEGVVETEFDMSRGFVVRGQDTANFLQEKLAYLGLTPREYNEFIVYWLPRMQNNPYNLITFQTSAYDEAAPLVVSPQPDSMLRVFMAYQPLDAYVSVPEPTLETFQREGFCVIEWGGCEIGRPMEIQ